MDAAERIQPFTVPKWGLSMEDAQVVAWHATEGAAVAEGDELVDIETPKIANGVESPVAGTLRRIVAQPGETVVVGQLLAVIAGDDVDDREIDAFVDDFRRRFAPPEPGAVEQSAVAVVDAGGRRIGYVAAGAEAAATPALLIHGFGGDSSNWMFNLPALARDRRVFAVDLPGHGSSGKDVGDGSLATLASAVLAFMDATGLSRAHLVGHSLGAAVALQLAGAHRERVTSLSLVAPVGLDGRVDEGFTRGFVDARSRREMKAALERLVADPSAVSREMVDDVLKTRRLDGATEALSAIADSVFARGEVAGWEALLAELGERVMIVRGERDSIVERAGAEPPAPAAVHVLPGVGHMPHMEAPAAVNQLLRAHMERCGA